jgi:DNA adenine methylase
VQLAWAFWLCTNFAFSNKIGAGYKYSNDMSCSVPDTLKKRKTLFTEALVARIEHCYIENEDAVKVAMSRDTFKTFHYWDPPYPNADQGHYANLPGGSKYTFEDYEKLLDFASRCKGKFLLSSFNSEMLTTFIHKFGWHKKEITYLIGGAIKSNPRLHRKDKTEVLVSNYDTPCGTLKLF